MFELINKLGIDWRLLLAQAFNFTLVLIILRLTIYKPLLKTLALRREKISTGLADAEMAKNSRLEANQVLQIKIKEAEFKSREIMDAALARGKTVEERIENEAKNKSEHIIRLAEDRASNIISEEKEKFYFEAINFIKIGIEKSVNLKPKEIDDALIKEALKTIKSI